jgi:hypothetical protein
MRNIKQHLKAFTDAYDNTCRRVSVGSGLLAFGGLAMAVDGEIDTADILLKIGAGAAAALIVSVAFTGAILGIRASKLARRG